MSNEELKLPDDFKVPADWRQLDLDIWKKLAMLEAKLKRSEDRQKGMLDFLEKTTKDIAQLAEDQLILIRKLAKLDEVYYHVFPERLAQDVKFEKQLDKLTAKSDPDVPPQKT